MLFVKGNKGAGTGEQWSMGTEEQGNWEMMADAIRETAGGSLLLIEVQPGSSRPGRFSYDRWRKRLKLTVGEKAERGRANAEALATLSAALGVPAASLRIRAGSTGRRKTVAVAGLSPSQVLERMGPLSEEP
jgi:uncharacterized protein (TIGR00251 family)